MSARLNGKVAIVTGGGRGIGEAIARRLASDGAKIVLAQRTLAEGERTAATLRAAGGDALVVEADITVEDSVAAMVEKAVATYVRVDILVNNAGTGVLEGITDITMEGYDLVMDTNVRGVVLAMKHAGRAMVTEGSGNIVNIASFNAFVGLRHFAAYCASKAAVVNLTRQVALDLGRHNIRVNAVAPGYIANPMAQGYFDSHVDPAALKSEALKSIPLGRLGTNDDVAGVVSFLTSDVSAFVTGETIVVDGGTLCHGPYAD